jgi:phytanoyl-CoA hydroxylase
MTSLTSEQQEAYWRDGYVVVSNLFSDAELDSWHDRVRALARGEADPPKNMVLVRDVEVAKGAKAFEDPEQYVCKINFFEHDPVLMEYGRNARLLDAIEDLLGDDITFVNSMCITKPPEVDARHPLHQDLLYFGFRPADAMLGTWTALEPVTRENGCLAVLPGSHKGELLEHDLPDWDYVNAGFLGAKGFDASERVHLPMNRGDTLLFHSLLIHGSGTNRTEGFRRIISSHFARTGCDDLWKGKDEISSRPWIPVRGEGASGSA